MTVAVIDGLCASCYDLSNSFSMSEYCQAHAQSKWSYAAGATFQRIVKLAVSFVWSFAFYKIASRPWDKAKPLIYSTITCCSLHTANSPSMASWARRAHQAGRIRYTGSYLP